MLEYGNEEATEQIIKTIHLHDFADKEMPQPDICDLIDITPTKQLTGFSLKSWDGNPLTSADFDESPVKQCYNTIDGIYAKVCDEMWESAQLIYQTACRYGLNHSEFEEKNIIMDFGFVKRFLRIFTPMHD